jgi:hypothetical protein
MFPLPYSQLQAPLFSQPIGLPRMPPPPPPPPPPAAAAGNASSGGSLPLTPQHSLPGSPALSFQLHPHYLQQPQNLQHHHHFHRPTGMSPLLLSSGVIPSVSFPCLPQPQPLFAYPQTGGNNISSNNNNNSGSTSLPGSCHHSDRSRATTPSADSEGTSRLGARSLTQAKKPRRRQLDKSPLKQNLAAPSTGLNSAPQAAQGGPSLRRVVPRPKLFVHGNSGAASHTEQLPIRADVDSRIVGVPTKNSETIPAKEVGAGAEQTITSQAESSLCEAERSVPSEEKKMEGPTPQESLLSSLPPRRQAATPPASESTLPNLISTREMPIERPEQHRQQAATAQEIKDLDEHRIAQRVKQINFGKVTPGYRSYRTAVPQWRRQVHNPRHPETPDVRAPCSKRKWDQEVAAWRRSLHQWDGNPDPLLIVDPECNHFFTHHAEMSMDEYLRMTIKELEAIHADVSLNHGAAAAASSSIMTSQVKHHDCDRHGFCSTTAGETEVSTDAATGSGGSGAEEPPAVLMAGVVSSPQHHMTIPLQPLDEEHLASREDTPRWDFACAPFDYSPQAGPSHSAGRSHHHRPHSRSGSHSALSPIRPAAATASSSPSASLHRHTPVRTTISWSEASGADVPRVRIPINFHQGSRIRPLVLIMDGGIRDKVPIYEKLRATFQLEKLFVESCCQQDGSISNRHSSPAASSSGDVASDTASLKAAGLPTVIAVDSVEQVGRLLQQGRQHNMLLSLPKLTYRGELLHQKNHFFEQTDDIQREMMGFGIPTGTPQSHQQSLQRVQSGSSCGGFPSTPDRLTFRVTSADKHSVSFSPSMSAVKVNATPNTFCFPQGQTVRSTSAGVSGRDSAPTPIELVGEW